MRDINTKKDILIDQLWLPIAKQGGSVLFPRLKINKNMKMLTLTHHNNCCELEEFIKNKLTRKDLITGWHKETNEAIRLECEKLESARGGYVFEDVMRDSPSDIQDIFPFDILNLDFSSQSPEFEEGRVAREINGVEHTIDLQTQKGKTGMILIYTTVLNSKPLDSSSIKQSSDSLRINGWSGLSIDNMTPNIVDNGEKTSAVRNVIEQIYSKYNYEIKHLQKMLETLPGGANCILSIGAVLKRR